VERELVASGHECHRLGIGLDLERSRRDLLALRPDLVFNLVESLGGTGRLGHLAPALVEALGLPCTGAWAIAFAATTDTLRTKRRLVEAGLPTPPWIHGDAPRRESAVGPAPAGWIVKPVFEDASVDVDDDSLVDDVASALRRIAASKRPCLAEAFVAGREFNLALLEKSDGVELLPPAEIRFEGWPETKPRIVGYAAKWRSDSFESRHTPRHFDFEPGDAGLLARLSALAHCCWELFSLSGFARVDFRVDDEGHPSILEVNANPCPSPDAGFAAAAQRAGLPAREVVERICSAALLRKRD
jgi:D-alanine-D-alanine ligase